MQKINLKLLTHALIYGSCLAKLLSISSLKPFVRFYFIKESTFRLLSSLLGLSFLVRRRSCF